MNDYAIKVENLAKLYKLGGPQASDSLREAITSFFSAPIRRFRELSEASSAEHDFWALKDVSFNVARGEVLGVVGRNGAGKSTLLKVLSRIVEPTSGTAVMRGRVSSLLEVGTGFHPELTGRENVFMNGSILGMRRREIEKKFDEIVAFAEIERFLDTPVKRYSSGMYVRLAFAVAAHLEPEILIVDEVLAVGDTQFQQKCIGKIKDISTSGNRTVIFVSHNMGAVRALCTSCLFLVRGNVEMQGDVQSVIERYLKPDGETQGRGVVSRHGIQLFEAGIYASQETDGPTRIVYFMQPCEIRVRIGAADGFSMTALVVRVYDELGALVTSLNSTEEGIPAFTLGDSATFRYPIPAMTLMPGVYTVSIYVYRPHDPTQYLQADSFFEFEVFPAVLPGGMLAYTGDHGVARVVGGCQLE